MFTELRHAGRVIDDQRAVWGEAVETVVIGHFAWRSPLTLPTKSVPEPEGIRGCAAWAASSRTVERVRDQSSCVPRPLRWTYIPRCTKTTGTAPIVCRAIVAHDLNRPRNGQRGHLTSGGGKRVWEFRSPQPLSWKAISFDVSACRLCGSSRRPCHALASPSTSQDSPF
jgi:hypothetical protein